MSADPLGILPSFLECRQDVFCDEVRPHVLVVDDDRRLRDLLSQYLSENGVIVSIAPGPQEAKNLMERVCFDMVILDVMMPHESGFEVATWMRGHNFLAPILFLSAKGEIDDRLKGFECGGDDYLPKPFAPKELVARTNALLRRGSAAQNGNTSGNIESGEITFGTCSFKLRTSILMQNDQEVVLTQVERQILKELLLSPHIPLSRDFLAEKVSQGANARSIDVQLVRLRRKVEKDSKHPRYLQTCRNKGYVFIPD